MSKSLESLQHEIEICFELAQKMGIGLYGIVQVSDGAMPVISMRGSEPRIAASINKLAIARWLVDFSGELANTFSWTENERLEGGGIYDGDNSRFEASLDELVVDMIKNSGNTAAKILGRNNVDKTNLHMQEIGLSNSQLIALGKGTFSTGQTTSIEALQLITDFAKNQSSAGLSGLIADSLIESRGYIAKNFLKNDKLVILSKWGALNPYKNQNYFVRNEVGLMKNQTRLSVGYSLFSESLDAYRSKIAVEIIGQIGTDLADYLGIRRIKMTERLLQVMRP